MTTIRYCRNVKCYSQHKKKVVSYLFIYVFKNNDLWIYNSWESEAAYFSSCHKSLLANNNLACTALWDCIVIQGLYKYNWIELKNCKNSSRSVITDESDTTWTETSRGRRAAAAAAAAASSSSSSPPPPPTCPATYPPGWGWAESILWTHGKQPTGNMTSNNVSGDPSLVAGVIHKRAALSILSAVLSLYDERRSKDPNASQSSELVLA